MKSSLFSRATARADKPRPRFSRSRLTLSTSNGTRSFTSRRASSRRPSEIADGLAHSVNQRHSEPAWSAGAAERCRGTLPYPCRTGPATRLEKCGQIAQNEREPLTESRRMSRVSRNGSVRSGHHIAAGAGPAGVGNRPDYRASSPASYSRKRRKHMHNPSSSHRRPAVLAIAPTGSYCGLPCLLQRIADNNGYEARIA